MNRPVEPIQAPPEPRVSLAIEPDAERTGEFLRKLMTDARAWAEERRRGQEAA